MYDFIEVECNGPVTTITLNRPQVLNAINPQMHVELEAAFDEFAQRDEQRVCVITGAGERAFCAGSDLKAQARDSGFTYPPHGYAGLIERFDLYKPVIAAVNGICLGGGFEMALACDLIVASDQAIFGLPEPLVGAVALAGGIHRLVRQTGLKRAMGYLLTGVRMTPHEAFELGLLNEVVPPGAMKAAVQRWCERLLLVAPLALKATKEAALRGLDEPSLGAAIRAQHGYPGYQRWWQAEDTREGVRAFAEKRSPVWRGR
jgi:enoyl-CoA hydratase/carnithine racemase